MDAGQRELVSVAKEIEMLAEKNLCGWDDATMREVARAIKSMIRIKVSLAMSIEELARYVGVSPRTIRRRVQEGLLPKPKRYGHQEISFLKDEVDEYLDKNRKSGKSL